VARFPRRRPRRGSATQACDEPAAGVRRQEHRAPRRARRRTEDHGLPVRRVSAALRRPAPAARRCRGAVCPRPAARARPRLLHAHGLRVHRAGRERELDDLRRRALRQPRRGGGRSADPRGGLRRRARTSPSRDRARARAGGGAEARRLRRRRAGRVAVPVAARSSPCGVLGGHRLRAALAEGSADAGAKSRVAGRHPRARRHRHPPCAGRGRSPRRPRGAFARVGVVSGWRDVKASALRAGDAGTEVTVAGWVARRRDHGGLVFVDLRDDGGLLQVVLNPANAPEAAAAAHELRNEFVVQARGEIVRRAPETVNPAMDTGEIELQASTLKILSRSTPLPFQLDAEGVDETLRLRYRWLDLRRDKMQRNIRLRAKLVSIIREEMEADGFVDIETPIMAKPTPEGARDFLVPSRLQPGRFFALPQSPQIYKQLLVISGFERYYQIARCFRDEDLRADRLQELTQLD